MTEKITAADAIRLLDSGKAVAVDVREPDEYAVGHIPGAKLLPLGQVIDRAAEVLSDGFETQPAEDGSWTLPGVVSRKKQFIPAMMSAYQEL